MKKTLLILVLILSAFCVVTQAQSVNYRPFKVDFGLGGFPVGPSYSGGTTVEFHGLTDDTFALGMRGQIVGANYFYASLCATGDYYIPAWDKVGTRIFVGGGIGGFNESKILSNVSSTNFGLFPRIGLEAGHFRTSAEFDYTGGNASYFYISVGFFLGGGKKN